MPHLNTLPGQYDLTVSAFIVRGDPPRVLLHRHKTLGVWMQPGGHVELDETPWQAIIHEVREETGYEVDQLAVLQPALRLASLAGDDLHPQPVCLRSFPYGVGTGHFHTDLTYAFLTDQAPRHRPAQGESAELAWLTAAELAGLAPDQTYQDVRQVAWYILDQLLQSWEPVAVANSSASNSV
jgi:8-oxo-dGTP pyrophosphatase MutT (NUDIX family)